jgi:hypothetical protein
MIQIKMHSQTKVSHFFIQIIKFFYQYGAPHLLYRHFKLTNQQLQIFIFYLLLEFLNIYFWFLIFGLNICFIGSILF